MTGAFGAAVNGATMPVFAVLFSEVIQVSTATYKVLCCVTSLVTFILLELTVLD